MRRALIIVSVLLSLAAVAATGTVASAQPRPPAGAAGRCKSPHYPGSGYFTSLSVRHTSCRTGRKVALGYYHCRLHHGKRGRCHSRVKGYSCSERRTSIPTEIDSRVTCRRGGAKVVHTYQQNL
jgi:hypothetical protein